LLSLLDALPRTERTLPQLSGHVCQSAISSCELLGSCCFIAILLAHASKDKMPIGVSAPVAKRRFCGNGPRQQAAGTRRVAKRPDAFLPTGAAAQCLFREDISEKALHIILRIRREVTATLQEGIERRPIRIAKSESACCDSSFCSFFCADRINVQCVV
jgi:hypothetical protein